MLTSKDFIIQKIGKLIEQFPFLQIKYEYIGFDSSHCLEILPSSYYLQNEDYIAAENSILLTFMQQFPSETLFFVTEGDAYKVENPCHVAKGMNFDLEVLMLNYNVTTIYNDEKLEEYESVLPNSMSYYSHYAKVSIPKQAPKLSSFTEEQNTGSLLGETSFALAA